MDQTVGGMLGQEMVEEMLEKILPQKGGTIWVCSFENTVSTPTNWRYTAVKKGGDMHALLTCRMSMHTRESGHRWAWAHHSLSLPLRCTCYDLCHLIPDLFLRGRGFLSVVKPARDRTHMLGCAGIVERGVCAATKAHLCIQLVKKILTDFLLFTESPTPPKKPNLGEGVCVRKRISGWMRGFFF